MAPRPLQLPQQLPALRASAAAILLPHLSLHQAVRAPCLHRRRFTQTVRALHLLLHRLLTVLHHQQLRCHLRLVLSSGAWMVTWRCETSGLPTLPAALTRTQAQMKLHLQLVQRRQVQELVLQVHL